MAETLYRATPNGVEPIPEQEAAAIRAEQATWERTRLLRRVSALRDAKLAAGYEHDFGAAGVHRLQTRDDADRINWLVSQAAYASAVAAGAGAVVEARFRSAHNVTFAVSYADGHAALLAMAAWGAAVMNRAWQLKDQIQATADAELASINVEAGWPS